VHKKEHKVGGQTFQETRNGLSFKSRSAFLMNFFF